MTNCVTINFVVLIKARFSVTRRAVDGENKTKVIFHLFANILENIDSHTILCCYLRRKLIKNITHNIFRLFWHSLITKLNTNNNQMLYHTMLIKNFYYDKKHFLSLNLVILLYLFSLYMCENIFPFVIGGLRTFFGSNFSNRNSTFNVAYTFYNFNISHKTKFSNMQRYL